MSVFSAAFHQPLIVFAVLLSVLFVDAGYASKNKVTVKYQQTSEGSSIEFEIDAAMTEPDEQGGAAVSFSVGSVTENDEPTPNYPAENFNTGNTNLLSLYQQAISDTDIAQTYSVFIPIVPSELLDPGESGFTLTPGESQAYIPAVEEASQSLFVGTLTTGAGESSQQWSVEFRPTAQHNMIQLQQAMGAAVTTITILWQLASTSFDPACANLPEAAAIPEQLGAPASPDAPHLQQSAPDPGAAQIPNEGAKGEMAQSPEPSSSSSEHSGGDVESAYQGEQERSSLNPRKRQRMEGRSSSESSGSSQDSTDSESGSSSCEGSEEDSESDDEPPIKISRVDQAEESEEGGSSEDDSEEGPGEEESDEESSSSDSSNFGSFEEMKALQSRISILSSDKKNHFDIRPDSDFDGQF